MTDLHLEWIDENLQMRRLEIIDKVFIGRTCEGVDPRKRILLPDPIVSREHAVISREGGRLKITDRSKNGTWVNSVRVAYGSFKKLEPEDIIHIGESFFKVVFPPYAFFENYDDTGTGSTMITPAEVTVTNLVADIRRFAEFSQFHASSEVYRIIKEIFDNFSKIVNAYRGTIKDYAGDAIYAFWDHQAETPARVAVLACQAALKQQQHFNKILTKLSDRYSDVGNLKMGWGITTGRVTMSHFGSRIADMAMIGNCINLAFRLSGLANKDLNEKTLICSQTAELVKRKLPITDLGMISIRGRKGNEHLFALGEFPA
jgi:class 3 adenylate cyclase